MLLGSAKPEQGRAGLRSRTSTELVLNPPSCAGRDGDGLRLLRERRAARRSAGGRCAAGGGEGPRVLLTLGGASGFVACTLPPCPTPPSGLPVSRSLSHGSREADRLAQRTDAEPACSTPPPCYPLPLVQAACRWASAPAQPCATRSWTRTRASAPTCRSSTSERAGGAADWWYCTPASGYHPAARVARHAGQEQPLHRVGQGFTLARAASGCAPCLTIHAPRPPPGTLQGGRAGGCPRGGRLLHPQRHRGGPAQPDHRLRHRHLSAAQQGAAGRLARPAGGASRRWRLLPGAPLAQAARSAP